jgi:hypothetical protein
LAPNQDVDQDRLAPDQDAQDGAAQHMQASFNGKNTYNSKHKSDRMLMHEVQSDFQGEQPDEGSIRIDVAAHGITDLNTQQILSEQGPTLKICSQHRVLSIALFLYQ